MGLLPDPIGHYGFSLAKERSAVYTSADEHANNKRGFYWLGFGNRFFGQDITHWSPITPLENDKD